MQRVTPDIGTSFEPAYDVLQSAFLLDLFKGDTSQIPGISVTSLTVYQSGISLPDPTHTAVANWTASCVIKVHLVAALNGMAEFGQGIMPY